MTNLLDRLPLGSSVVLIRLRSIGDCVLTTPAITLLAAHRPDLRLSVVVEPWCRFVYHGNPHLHASLDPDWRGIRDQKPALCLNLHGGTHSFWLTLASGARFRASFAHYRQPWAYNLRIPRAQQILGQERPVHTAEHVASAMFHLGVPPTEIPASSVYADPSSEPGPYAVLHPFASQPDKCWPPERFAALGHWLQGQGLRVLITGTTSEDWSPFAAFEQRHALTGEQLKSLICGATLFVGNDSGPAHLAAALRVPLLALFGPSDFDVWKPWKAHGQGLQAPNQDLSRLTVETVQTAAAQLLVTA